MTLVVAVILWNWAGALALSWLYCGLWWVTGDLRFCGWLFWRGWFPVARFRVVSHDSWFYRAWDRFYGLSLLFCIIHRDEPGPHDSLQVQETIIHEMRHVSQQLVCGVAFSVWYGVDVGINGYWGCWAERDARRHVMLWVQAGRPPRYRVAMV